MALAIALPTGLGVALLPLPGGAAASLTRVDLQATEPVTRVSLNVDHAVRWRLFTLDSPQRVVVDLLDSQLPAGGLRLPGGQGGIARLRMGQRSDGALRLVMDIAGAVGEPRSALRSNAHGLDLTIELPTLTPSAAVAAAAAENRNQPAETPTAAAGTTSPDTAEPAGETSTGQPFLPPGREIVIAVDAGHGGKDPGAHGPNGVLEKDVTLQIARRLAETISAQPGMRGVLTRDRDEFIPLRGRMERARAAQADLFISIHADAVRDRDVRGASVYVLNEKGATDEAARRLAARENAADLIGGVSLGDKDPTLASVLLDVSQNASLSSSVAVGDDILKGLARVGLVRKPRVLQAPFMVLKSPDVPSVLVETAYISNPAEERNLDDDDYRRKLAHAIYAGVTRYFRENPPARVLVAANATPVAARGRRHTARRGETLELIAGRYNVSVTEIRQVNRLRTGRIAAGQVLRIPAAAGT